MGTLYYIVKPETKEIFYLGRRITTLDGIPDWDHKQKAEYSSWECWDDLLIDLQENNKYFLEGSTDFTIGQIWDFASEIMTFCEDYPVYLDNDCSDNFSVWKDWKEIDFLSDIQTKEERWCSLIDLIPKEEWVIEDHIIDEFETVKKYLEKERK